MKGLARRVLGSALAMGATALLAALSRAPQRTGDGNAALLRLSWSGQPERIEVCRTLGDEELRTLPRHMRQPVICEGRAAAYRLRVTADGTTLADDLVTGGGLRRDRPLYLYREFALAPGARALAVRFDVSDGAAATGGHRSSPPRLDALPRALALDTTVVLPERAVALVTYDPERGALVIRSRGR